MRNNNLRSYRLCELEGRISRRGYRTIFLRVFLFLIIRLRVLFLFTEFGKLCNSIAMCNIVLLLLIKEILILKGRMDI